MRFGLIIIIHVSSYNSESFFEVSCMRSEKDKYGYRDLRIRKIYILSC